METVIKSGIAAGFGLLASQLFWGLLLATPAPNRPCLTPRPHPGAVLLISIMMRAAVLAAVAVSSVWAQSLCHVQLHPLDALETAPPCGTVAPVDGDDYIPPDDEMLDIDLRPSVGYTTHTATSSECQHVTQQHKCQSSTPTPPWQ